MEGFVYVLTNEFMPSIVKIGYTNRSPEQRAWELYDKRTGVPGKFKVAYKFKCKDAKLLEKKVHRHLAGKRANTYREFFSITVSEAVSVIEELSLQHVPPQKQTPTSPTPPSDAAPSAAEAPSSPQQSVQTTIRPSEKDLHSLKSWYEEKKREADSSSRAIAGGVIALLCVPVISFINEQFYEAGVEDPPYTVHLLSLVISYSLLRRFIGCLKTQRIDEEYQQRIERM